MCGIVGYVGQREAAPVLVEGLRRLEYRGYDSAGVATVTGSHLHLHKRAGRIARLAAHLEDHPSPGTTGIGHTRWATHGPANDRNAHPHLGGDGVVAVVHNGVIENYTALKRQLIEEGFVFHSDTDTEVIAHLIARHLNGDGLIGAVSEVLPLLKGTYGLAVVSRLEPGLIVARGWAVRWFSASATANVFWPATPGALAGFATKVVYLQDHQTCELTAADWHVSDRNRLMVPASVHDLDLATEEYDAGGFEHFMRKEIHEQPEALENALRGRLEESDGTAHFGGLNLDVQTAAAGGSHRHDGVRHQLSRRSRRRISVRGVRANAGGSRVRQRSSATAIRRWTVIPSSWR